MKLQNEFLGIAFHRIIEFQKLFIDSMTNLEVLAGVRKSFPNYDMNERLEAMKQIASSADNKIYYISRKVQEHASLVKYEKINLNWFKKLKGGNFTYIINKNEFYRFWINEGKSIHIGHFYPEPNYAGTIKDNMGAAMPKDWKSMENLPVSKWDVFPIRFNMDEHPNGYMPIDPSQNNLPKEFFVKLLLFMELSKVEEHFIKPNQKINISPTPGRNFDNKIKNESGVNVTFVNTSWNKIIIVNGEFKVGGHWRVQPCGPKRADYKLTWIDDYKKSGYMRRAPMQIVNENA